MDNAKGKFEDNGSERAVIAALLSNADLLVDVEAKLDESDFLSEHHRPLYAILRYLSKEGVRSFDLMAVVDVAERKGLLKSIGDMAYVQALMSMPIDGSNIGVYIGKVLDASLKYKLFMQAEYIQKDLLQSIDSEQSSEEIIAKAEGRIIDVSMSSKRVEDAVDVSEGLRETLKKLAENPVEISGLTTGIHLLDKALNGLKPGTLTVLAARAKEGKSTLLMNIASHIAYDLGLPILYIDTEMRTVEVRTRLLSHISSVPERSIQTGKWIANDSYTRRVDAAMDKVERGQMLHRYYPGYSIDGLVSLARKYHAREGVAAIFFDYIKMPETNSRDAKETQILGQVATALKDLAGTLNIPVITAAQMKRASNSDKSGPKTLYSDQDVGDSDKIGRYCDTLLALARKSQKEIEEDGLDCGTHRVQVLLARGGGTLYRGIDMSCHFPTLTMTQARNQSNGIPNFEGESDSSDKW
jgi:replicative DNA helicase